MNVAELSPQASPNRAQRRAGRTRKRLLAAGLANFSEKGLDLTSIEDITELADVGKGTFYRHFTSKSELMMALVEESAGRLVARIHAHPKPIVDLQGALEHLLDAHAGFFAENTDEFVLLFQGRLLLKLRRDTGELEQPYMQYLREIEMQLAPFVPQPIESAKVRRLAHAVAGFVSGFFSFAMIGMAPEEIEASLGPLRHAFVASSSAFLGK